MGAALGDMTHTMEDALSTGIWFEVSKVERETITLEVQDAEGKPIPLEVFGIKSTKTLTVPRTEGLRSAQPGDRFELVPIPQQLPD